MVNQAEQFQTEQLPVNLDAERFILGAILTDEAAFFNVSGSKITEDDFSLEKHKVIFRRMADLSGRREHIDRVTVANELHRHGELPSVDGLSYLVTLDDGLPQIYNIESYCRIVKEKSLLRLLIRRLHAASRLAMSGTQAPDEIAADCASRLIDISKGTSFDTGLASLEKTVLDYGVDAMVNPASRQAGLGTGFLRFDDMTGGGLRPGELIILAARPAMGKTAFALSIAQHVACHPKKPKAVAVFSLEMSKESLMQRLLCMHARVDLRKHRSGYVNAEERSRLEESLSILAEAPIFIDDSAGIDLMDIYSNVLRLQQDQDVGLVVIDYLQLMGGTSGRRRESRQQDVSDLSRGLKLMSKDLKLPFLVLSQLSRAPEQRQGDHRPMLSDLRESGSIEQDADMVGFIFREEVYRPDKESLKGIAELLVAKQRNGPTGKVKLAFLSQYTKFENLAFDVGDELDTPPPEQPWRPSGGGLFAVPENDDLGGIQ